MSTTSTTSRVRRSPCCKKYGHGIIGSSACIAGIIPKLLDNRQFDDAVEWARRFASCFDEGDFYIELQNQGLRTDAGMTQTELNRQLTKVAQLAGLKTIATNDFHYLKKEDAKAQDIMLCIGTGSAVNDANRMRFENDEFYMKTEEEMREALSEFPEACDNTVEVAEKIDVVLERDSILPRFPLPEGETEESWFRKQCEWGLKKRYGDPVPKEAWDRYEYEAGIILQQGFPAYFLIVQEYIAWTRSQGNRRRSGPWFGRRRHLHLCHGHHRPRSAPQRASVRALPVARTRGDARYRR